MYVLTESWFHSSSCFLAQFYLWWLQLSSICLYSRTVFFFKVRHDSFQQALSVLHSDHHHRVTLAFVVPQSRKQVEHHHNHSSQGQHGMAWVWQDPLRILALGKVRDKVISRHFTVEEIWKCSHNCFSKSFDLQTGTSFPECFVLYLLEQSRNTQDKLHPFWNRKFITCLWSDCNCLIC